MGAETFQIQTPAKYGLLQMLNEGFNDLTNDKVSCDLLSAVFGVKVSVNPMGLTTSQNFFTGTTLVSAPSDNLYYDTVKDRVGIIEEDLNELKRWGIMVDRDEEGYLLQIFTKPV